MNRIFCIALAALVSLSASAQTIVQVRAGGNKYSSPFDHPTNAWNYLISRGSNNWVLDIGPGLWTVSAGYGAYGGRGGFHTDGNLRNVRITGSGMYTTIISNSMWGDVFFLGTNSNNIEMDNFGFKQPRTGDGAILTNGIGSNYISSIIANYTDDRTLSSNYFIHDIYAESVQDLGIFIRANQVLMENIHVQGLGTTNLSINNSHQPDGMCIGGSGSDWIVRNCFFYDVCYGLEVGGHPSAVGIRTNRNWLIENVYCSSWVSAFNLFPDTTMRFENVVFKNCTASTVVGYTNVSIQGARNAPCDKGFLFGGDAYNVTIDGCTTINCMNGVLTSITTGHLSELTVKDSTFLHDGAQVAFDSSSTWTGISAAPINSFGTNNIVNARIEGNTIKGVPLYAMNIAGTNMTVRGNTIINSGYQGAFGIGFAISTNLFSANQIRLGNIVIEDNLLISQGVTMDYGCLISSGVTNVVYRNNRQIGGTERLGGGAAASTGLFTNVTWNSMWGNQGTNFSVGVAY